jgi:hypothetical protein
MSVGREPYDGPASQRPHHVPRSAGEDADLLHAPRGYRGKREERVLENNDEVSFEVVRGAKGPEARNVSRV